MQIIHEQIFSILSKFDVNICLKFALRMSFLCTFHCAEEKQESDGNIGQGNTG